MSMDLRIFQVNREGSRKSQHLPSFLKVNENKVNQLREQKVKTCIWNRKKKHIRSTGNILYEVACPDSKVALSVSLFEIT